MTRVEPTQVAELADLVVIGASAAGLMTAIACARASGAGNRPRIVALDAARTLGAKILVAGGGRCNVTHFEVSADDFAGSSRPAIAKVLRAFPVEATIELFRELGVDLVREPTGKLFPSTHRARTVLDALLRAAAAAGIQIAHPRRVETIARAPGGGFVVAGAWGELAARRVVLAAGGRALPKSGSDGSGYTLARALGHSVTKEIFPALVPLLVADGHWIRTLPGVAAPARLEVRSSTGKRLATFRGDLLCTHFGLSGPVVLDASRHLLAARHRDSGAALAIAFLPDAAAEALDAELVALGRRSIGAWLAGRRDARLPERLALALFESAGVAPDTLGTQLRREQRRALVRALTELVVPVVGDRGFEHAEATAGGVPLAEVDLATMESRRTPGLHLVGELLDVDGRIGGFNFQWAWSSGVIAGRAAAAALGAGRAVAAALDRDRTALESDARRATVA